MEEIKERQAGIRGGGNKRKAGRNKRWRKLKKDRLEFEVDEMKERQAGIRGGGNKRKAGRSKRWRK